MAPLNGQYRCEASPIHHGATWALHEGVTLETTREVAGVQYLRAPVQATGAEGARGYLPGRWSEGTSTEAWKIAARQHLEAHAR